MPFPHRSPLPTARWHLAAALLLAFATLSPLQGRPSVGGVDREIENLSREQAAERLQQFRYSRLQGDYTFQFVLEHLPRRGEEKLYQGVLFGTWSEYGPLTRVILQDEEGRPVPAQDPEKGHNLLFLGGPHATVWKTNGEGQAVIIPTGQQLEPIVEGLFYTPFDLLMPFVFWEHWEYDGNRRMKGRPAQLFIMHPPEAFTRAYPQIAYIRMAIDDRFNALLRVDVIGPNDELERSFEILDFKKTQEQWMVKRIDLVNRQTWDKTRFEVTAAAMDQPLPPELFDPDHLGSALPDLRSLTFDQF